MYEPPEDDPEAAEPDEQAALMREASELPVMDEEDALRGEFAEREFRLIHKFRRALLLLHPHAPMQVECLAFVLRLGDVFEITDQKGIAVRHGNVPEAKRKATAWRNPIMKTAEDGSLAQYADEYPTLLRMNAKQFQKDGKERAKPEVIDARGVDAIAFRDRHHPVFDAEQVEDEVLVERAHLFERHPLDLVGDHRGGGL